MSMSAYALFRLSIYPKKAPLVEPVETWRWFRQAQPTPTRILG
jgi:hypothetical protein